MVSWSPAQMSKVAQLHILDVAPEHALYSKLLQDPVICTVVSPVDPQHTSVAPEFKLYISKERDNVYIILLYIN